VEPPVAYERSFDARYGLIIDEPTEDGVLHGRIPVREDLLTRHGFVHGGVLAAAAEAIASTGTFVAVMGDGYAAMGQSNDTTLLATVSAGEIRATARVVHRGDDAWVWTVDACDADGAPVAHSRVTVAVRPMRR
jgi:1,4-dihydroxy-2-naphthoyl-CoA hydrolase